MYANPVWLKSFGAEVDLPGVLDPGAGLVFLCRQEEEVEAMVPRVETLLGDGVRDLDGNLVLPIFWFISDVKEGSNPLPQVQEALPHLRLEASRENPLWGSLPLNVRKTLLHQAVLFLSGAKALGIDLPLEALAGLLEGGRLIRATAPREERLALAALAAYHHHRRRPEGRIWVIGNDGERLFDGLDRLAKHFGTPILWDRLALGNLEDLEGEKDLVLLLDSGLFPGSQLAQIARQASWQVHLL